MKLVDDELLKKLPSYLKNTVQSPGATSYLMLWIKKWWIFKEIIEIKDMERLLNDASVLKRIVQNCVFESFMENNKIYLTMYVETQEYKDFLMNNKVIFNLMEKLVSVYYEDVTKNCIYKINVVVKKELNKGNKKIFLAISYTDQAIDTENVIKKVINNGTEWELLVAKDELNSSSIEISDKVKKLIEDSDFAIIDLSLYERDKRNEGVLYEFGIIDNSKKPYILIIRKVDYDNFPPHSDYKNKDMLIFKNNEELESELQKRIEKIFK